MTSQPRFIVLEQCGQYIVHDRDVGDDSTPMARYSSAKHLAAQWEKQAERDAAYEAAKSDGTLTRWRDERALSAQVQRMPGRGFLNG